MDYHFQHDIHILCIRPYCETNRQVDRESQKSKIIYWDIFCDYSYFMENLKNNIPMNVVYKFINRIQ